jgi:predicted enzyme related to lactoylglutathione lyase
MSDTTAPALRQIIVPIEDMDAALAHYVDALGLELKFRDGDRWAALTLGDVTLALAGPGEQPAEPGIALGIKVADLDATLGALAEHGATALEQPRDGAHERRVTIRDAAGTLTVLYEPKPS